METVKDGYFHADDDADLGSGIDIDKKIGPAALAYSVTEGWGEVGVVTETRHE